MAEMFAYPWVQAVLLLGVIFAITVAGVYVVRKFRDHAESAEPVTSDLISKFRDLHLRGELTEEEYRTIRTVLAIKVQGELKDNGDED